MLKKILAVICAIALILSLSVTAYAAEAPAGHNGWWTDEDNGNIYYYVDGEKCTPGFHEIEGSKYYFDYYGAVQIGIFTYNKKWYMTDNNGAVIEANGWHNAVDTYGDENTYYFYEDGSIAKGEFLIIGGKKYYFNDQAYLEKDGCFDAYDSDGTWYAYLALADGSIVTQTGWYRYYNSFTEEYDWYYIEKADGKLARGFRELGGDIYHFDYWGRMSEDVCFSEYNEQFDREVYHYADADGHVLTDAGWHKTVKTYVNSPEEYTYWYYVKNAELYEVACDEFLQIGGTTYYFEPLGTMATNTFDIHDDKTDEVKRYVADCNGVVKNTKGWHWVELNPNYNKWFYVYADGTYAYSCIEVIDGRKYAFDDWGNMQTGMFEFENKIYHTDDAGAIVDTPNTWFKYGGHWHYIKADGNIARNEAVEIGGNTYVFNFNGEMQVGYCSTEEGIFYTDNSGAALKNQWIQDGLCWYFAKADGTLANHEWMGNYFFDYGGTMCVGKAETDETWGYCYFDSNGVYQYQIGTAAGWQYADGYWFYYSAPNEPYNGWLQSGSNWYYIYDGLMVTNNTIAPDLMDESFEGDYEDAPRFYLNHQGIMQTGWILHPYGNIWLYANPDGTIATGWQQIGGTWYYFDTDGWMYNSDAVFLYDDQKWASFADSGAWLGYLNDGWYLDHSGDWYFFDGANTIDGEYTIGSSTYYFHYNRMLANEAFTEQEIYIDANGFVDNGTGWRLDRYENWYYLKDGKLTYGLEYINGAWYYFDPYMEIGYCHYYDTTTENYEYGFFNESGAWQPIGTGWYSINLYDDYTEWYYFVDGKVPSENYDYWYNVNGYNYLFNNGCMVHGVYWADNNQRYVFDKNGHLIRNQWVLLNDYWYYADATGRALTGEQNIGGTTYYFTEHGSWIK